MSVMLNEYSILRPFPLQHLLGLGSVDLAVCYPVIRRFSITCWYVLGLATVTAMLGVIIWAALNPPPPGEFTLQFFSAQYISRARAYQAQAYLLFATSRLIQLALLCFLAFTPAGQGLLASKMAQAHSTHNLLRPPLRAALIILTLTAVVRLPVSFYRGFLLEHRFGLSTQTLPAWILDWSKGWCIDTITTLIAVALLVPLVTARPGDWWLPAGFVLSSGLVLITLVGPLVIDPLYYRFTPLNDEELLVELRRMSEALDLDVDEILVADASRRTNRANAYFTGVGATQRIVLYDTLLTTFDRDQVTVVVAHELAHWARRHIWKGLALGAAGIFAGLWALNRLLSAEARSRGWPLTDPRLMAHVFLAVMVAGLLVMPVSNAVSRAMEREADAISYNLSANTGAAVKLATGLAVRNLSDPQPHPLLVALTFSHPPSIQRVKAAAGFAPPDVVE